MTEPRRSSLLIRIASGEKKLKYEKMIKMQSICAEARGSLCSANAKSPLTNPLTPPISAKRSTTTSTGGQLFLCVIGSLLSFSICIWLTVFSQDAQWRRFLFAAGAALCALLFAMLAIQTMRKAKHPPVEEAIPNLAQRRSTIARTTARKSTCGSTREESGLHELTAQSAKSAGRSASLTPYIS